MTKSIRQRLDNSQRMRDVVRLVTPSPRTQSNEQNQLPESQLQPIISNCKFVAEVRDSCIKVVIPTAVEGVDPVTEMMALTALMAQMHPLFDGEVSVFPMLSMYRNGLVREFCKSNLIVQGWTTQRALIDYIEDVLDYATQTGRSLRQKKMSVMVDSPAEHLMLLLNC